MDSRRIFDAMIECRSKMLEVGYFQGYEFKNHMESVFESEGYRENREDNILIINDAGIGDFVLLSPSIKAIRNHYPNAHITMLLNRNAYHLARTCPYADSIFYDPKCAEWSEMLPMYDWTLEFIKTLPPVKYDIAFCFNHRNAKILMAYMLGANKIVHYSSTVICSPYFLNLAVFTPMINCRMKTNYSKPHMVDRYLCMLDEYFGHEIEDRELEIWYEPKAMNTARKISAEYDFKTKTVFLLMMGGSSLDKHYPPEKYAELARKISERVPNAVFVNVGGSSDIESAEKFSNAFNDSERFISLVNRLNYAETAALISLCDCYIGNDTSAVHISAAMKIPCLQPNCFPMDHELKFDSSPLMYYPYRVPSISVMPIRSLPECVESEKFRGCGIETKPHCITQISVDSMLAGFDMLLEKIRKHDSTPNFIY